MFHLVVPHYCVACNIRSRCDIVSFPLRFHNGKNVHTAFRFGLIFRLVLRTITVAVGRPYLSRLVWGRGACLFPYYGYSSSDKSCRGKTLQIGNNGGARAMIHINNT